MDPVSIPKPTSRRPANKPTFFFSFRVITASRHAHRSLTSTPIQYRRPITDEGESETYFVNLVSTSYRENEKSGEVKEKEKKEKEIEIKRVGRGVWGDWSRV